VLAQDRRDVGLRQVEAQRLHRDLELMIIDPAVLVQVEQRERLVDLLALVLRQLRRRGALLRLLRLLCLPVLWSRRRAATEGVRWPAGAEVRRLRACCWVAAGGPVEACCVGSRGKVGLVRGHFERTRGMIEMWDGLRWSLRC